MWLKGKLTMNTKLFRTIRLSYAAVHFIKAKTFTRISAVTLFLAAMISLYAALATSTRGLPSNQRVVLGPEDQAVSLSVTVWLAAQRGNSRCIAAANVR